MREIFLWLHKSKICGSDPNCCEHCTAFLWLLFFNFTTVRRHVVAIFMEPLQFCPWIRISTLFFWKVTVRPSDIAHMIWTGSSFTVAIKFLSKLFDSMRNESADWLLESYFIAGAKILLFLQTWKTNQVFTQFTYTIMI